MQSNTQRIHTETRHTITMIDNNHMIQRTNTNLFFHRK